MIDQKNDKLASFNSFDIISFSRSLETTEENSLPKLEFEEYTSVRNISSGTDKELQELGKSLGANIIISSRFRDLEQRSGYSDELLSAEVIIFINALYVNTLEEISSSKAYWSWSNGEEITYFE
jgi:hypothetical protein